MQPFTRDTSPAWMSLAGIVILILIGFVPFLDKAFHIDDVMFLYYADAIGWNPLHVDAVSAYSMGLPTQISPYTSIHPLLVPYFLKIVRYFFGTREVVLHGFFLVFPVIAVLSLAIAARDYLGFSRSQASILGFLLCFSPAFLVNAQNLMADVPALALFLGAFALFARYSATRKKYYLAAAATSLILAIAGGYNYLFVVPVLLFVLFLHKRCAVATLKKPVFIIAALLVLLALYFLNKELIPLVSLQNGGITLTPELARGLQGSVLYDKIIYNIATTGGTFLVAVVLLFLYGQRPGWIFGSASLCLSVIAVLTADGYPTSDRLLLFILVNAGVLALYYLCTMVRVITVNPRVQAVSVFMCTWIVVVYLYNLLIAPIGSVRYLLPAFPFMWIYFVYGLVTGTRRIPKVVVVAAGCLVLAFGLASAYADYRYAGFYRDMAEEVRVFRGEGSAQPDVWYVGEWGMKYYMDRAGARYLPSQSRAPRAGDYLIIPEMPRFWAPHPDVQQRAEPYASRSFASMLPIRLFNRRSNAGFYCHFWGLLPFSLRSEPDEVFQIMKVTR